MYWGLTWGLKGPTLGRKGYKSESGIRQHHLLPPDISCPVYCVLTVVMKVSMVRNKTRKLLVTKTASVLPSVLHSQLCSTKTAIKQLLPTSFIVRCLHYTREIDWATIHNWQRLWKDCHYVHLHYSFYQSSVHLCLPDATDRMQKCCSDLFPPVHGWRGEFY